MSSRRHANLCTRHNQQQQQQQRLQGSLPGARDLLKPLELDHPTEGCWEGRVRAFKAPGGSGSVSAPVLSVPFNHIEQTRHSAGGSSREVLPLVLSSPGEDHDHFGSLSGTRLLVIFLVSDSQLHCAYTAPGSRMRAL